MDSNLRGQGRGILVLVARRIVLHYREKKYVPKSLVFGVGSFVYPIEMTGYHPSHTFVGKLVDLQ